MMSSGRAVQQNRIGKEEIKPSTREPAAGGNTHWEDLLLSIESVCAMDVTRS